MQILQPSFKLLKTFLTDNPELTQKYVDTSVKGISHVLGPLNVFMRHLLVVKGLDPDTNPGEKAARDLQLAMSQAFSTHQKSYDDDYDFSWVQKRFEETRGHLKELQLTKERYLDLTNLAKLPDDNDDGDFTLSRTAKSVVIKNNDPEKVQTEINEIAPVSLKREIRLKAEDSIPGVAKIRGSSLKAKLLAKIKEEATKTYPSEAAEVILDNDPINSLRAALFTIEKELGLNTEPKTKGGKKKNKTTKKYVPKKIVKVGDHYTNSDKANQQADLVKEMVAKGLCDSAPEAVAEQLKEMDKWSDESLGSLKRVLDRHVKPSPGSNSNDTKFRGNFRRISPKVL